MEENMEKIYAVVSSKSMDIKIDCSSLKYDFSYYNNGINSRIQASSIKSLSVHLSADQILLSEAKKDRTNQYYMKVCKNDFSYTDISDLQSYYKTELLTDSSECVTGNDAEYNLRFLFNRYINEGFIEFDNHLFNHFLQEMHKLNCYGPYSAIITNGEFLLVYSDKLGQNQIYQYNNINQIDDSVNIISDDIIAFSNKKLENRNPIELKKGEISVFQKTKRRFNSIYTQMNIKLNELPQVCKDILDLLRKVDTNITLNEMNERLIHDISQIIESISLLLSNKIIIQEPSDDINWNNPQARYFTNPSVRDLIDQYFGNNEG